MSLSVPAPRSSIGEILLAEIHALGAERGIYLGAAVAARGLPAGWRGGAVYVGPVASGDETEGHRVHGPGVFAVNSVSDWAEKLRAHSVIADQDERRRVIGEGLAGQAAALGLSIAEDAGLLDEVTGLVEWPVPLIGKIDADFMDLPPEVRELSMKVNQKYFALRDAEGRPHPILPLWRIWQRLMAGLRLSRGMSGCCARGSRMRGISGISIARHL